MSKKWILYEPAKSTVTRIIPELAVEIGLNESIVLLQISFWLMVSDNERDGRYWTYQSLRDMKEKAFPYWSHETIRRTVNNLKDAGYIQIGSYNKRTGDNTQWFALEPDKCSQLLSVVCQPVTKRDTLSQNEQPPTQNVTTLPETPTESTHSSTPRKRSTSSVPSKEACELLIKAWVESTGLIDIGATYTTKARLAKAKSMLNWTIPVTTDEIREYTKALVKMGKRPEFNFYDNDIPIWRSTNAPKPKPPVDPNKPMTETEYDLANMLEQQKREAALYERA